MKLKSYQLSELFPGSTNLFEPLEKVTFMVQSGYKLLLMALRTQSCMKCWGKCYKIYLNTGNDLRLQERERCGEEVTHLTYCHCLRDPFEDGWQGPEWRRFRLASKKKRIFILKPVQRRANRETVSLHRRAWMWLCGVRMTCSHGAGHCARGVNREDSVLLQWRFTNDNMLSQFSTLHQMDLTVIYVTWRLSTCCCFLLDLWLSVKPGRKFPDFLGIAVVG